MKWLDINVDASAANKNKILNVFWQLLEMCGRWRYIICRSKCYHLRWRELSEKSSMLVLYATVSPSIITIKWHKSSSPHIFTQFIFPFVLYSDFLGTEKRKKSLVYSNIVGCFIVFCRPLILFMRIIVLLLLFSHAMFWYEIWATRYNHKRVYVCVWIYDCWKQFGWRAKHEFSKMFFHWNWLSINQATSHINNTNTLSSLAAPCTSQLHIYSLHSECKAQCFAFWLSRFGCSAPHNCTEWHPQNE